VVAQMADRVAVMYQGRKVEEGPIDRVFDAPEAAYTRTLLSAVPRLGDMRGRPAPEPIPLPDQNPRKERPSEPASLESKALEVENLVCRFGIKGGLLRGTVAQVHAVEDVSFSVSAGEVLSIVGESGSGKSTTGRAILGLIPAASGRIVVAGQPLDITSARGLRRSWSQSQMVFQDPFSSLNPRMRLIDQVAEPLRNFGIAKGQDAADRVAQLFDRVRLPRSLLYRYPHELSGGQRQRVGIARAIAVQPKLIVADEAVSALDVLVQAHILNLLLELQADLGIAIVFISHDMAVVERMSHRTAVMFAGRIVEIGSRAAVFEDPRHPYTKSLLSAVPVADPRIRQIERAKRFAPNKSPIHPAGYAPAASVYEEVGNDHAVLVAPEMG